MFWYEKEEIMEKFAAGEYDIMVATTVIEVGIDIPNASVILIENAERFGLAQLHQLRGRVGRGEHQSHCILMTKDKLREYITTGKEEDRENQATIIRLKTMEESSDGFKISEIDMKLRGPGDVIGTKQSGLPEFLYADIVNDLDVMEKAQIDANEILASDPNLAYPQNKLIRNTLEKKKAILNSEDEK
jgi:ATP-dependent DNA helicase RecG